MEMILALCVSHEALSRKINVFVRLIFQPIIDLYISLCVSARNSTAYHNIITMMYLQYIYPLSSTVTVISYEVSALLFVLSACTVYNDSLFEMRHHPSK